MGLQVEALAAVNYVVRLLPLVQIAVVWLLFHEGRANVSIPAAAGVVIWVAFAVTPALHTVRQRHFKNWVEGGRPLCAPLGLRAHRSPLTATEPGARASWPLFALEILTAWFVWAAVAGRCLSGRASCVAGSVTMQIILRNYELCYEVGADHPTLL